MSFRSWQQETETEKERETEREREKEKKREKMGDALDIESLLINAAGVAAAEARNAAANKKLASNIASISQYFNDDKGQGLLLYQLACRFPADVAISHPERLDKIAEYIRAMKIKTKEQLEAALSFCSSVSDIDMSQFDDKAGVGLEITEEEISATIAQTISQFFETICEKKHKAIGVLLANLRKHPRLKFANGRIIKTHVDEQLKTTLEKIESAPAEHSDAPHIEQSVEPEAEQRDASAAEVPSSSEEDMLSNPLFPLPSNNNNTNTIISINGEKIAFSNSSALLQQHLRATGGKHVTRFPPEPNGYLHIGHAKACYIDFGLAAKHGGVTYLRFDDTNPEAEKVEYIDHIIEIVQWLGWKWDKVMISGIHK